MARVQIPFSVETHVEISSTTAIAPVVGATVAVKNRDTKAPASIYAAETGVSVIPSPVTDEYGNIPGWLEEGSYVITVSGGNPAISPVEKAWEAVRGDGVGIVANAVIAPPMLTTATAQLLVPTGTILPFGGSVLPGGYLWAIGENVSRTTYSNLFATYGTKWGSGNGTTTFGTPDLRGRTVYGADSFGGSGAAGRLVAQTFASDGLKNENTLGGVGGQGTHVLSTAELASHAHGATSTDFGHLHRAAGTDTFGRPFRFAYWDSSMGSGSGTKYVANLSATGPESITWNTLEASNPYFDEDTGVGTASIGTTISNAGSNTAHNNMPPYQVGCWIIKY